MARDKVTYESYEQDVFDNPPSGPVGAHRGSRPVITRIAPFIIVIVVAALLGAGAWAVSSGEYANLLNLKSSQSSSTTSATTKSKTKSKSTKSDSSSTADSTDSSSSDSSTSTDSSNTSTESSDSSTSDQSAQQSEQAATVNKATQVRVVNGTGVSGYAGQKADVLQTAGYTSVEAANPTGSLPSATVVWYQNESDKATAQDVANTLGISTVQQVQGLAAPITVVLMN
ncbi:LytR C-terminal domain-containing protein [Bifidobacterium imperatoris]|uniref:Cell wall integrity and stress response protein 1 n=1 Tax=Bifidobacterium imperatoris TaxID=2020965 RepID=A0A2N5IU69_9BIFI|nr:LytR C-terminal domain-containing protein [Bifidobacterium imperatoris]PLS25477.1 cell wall integrity and stress response protein 1 [Bifidobacterium imperatoris]QSY57057.1 LytR C-terminal domain-containing protein [Bifidobacterium imperatoris]